MHCCDLVELGALVAVKGPELAQSDVSFRPGSLEAYWAASKCRLDRWNRFLKDAASALGSQTHTKFLWKAIRPGLEEILASELLARVLAAAGAAHDRCHGQREAGPVLASVLTGHLESRRGTLELLLSEENATTARLNRLRRRVERWTDLCLAHLAPVIDPTPWAFSAERVQQFTLDLADEPPPDVGATASAVLFAALRASFLEQLLPEAANPDLNERLAAAVLRCLPPNLFHGAGVEPVQLLHRIEESTDHTQGMINELFTLDGLAPLPATFPAPPSWFGWN